MSTLKLHPSINRSWLASAIGVSRSFLHQVETGKRPMPKDKQDKLNEILREIVTSLAPNDENE